MVELRTSDGSTKSKVLPLRKSLTLGGFFEAWSVTSSNHGHILRFSDSSICVEPRGRSLLLSFPSSLHVASERQEIFSPSDVSSIRRVTILQPSLERKLRFAFPNGSTLNICIEDSTKQDFVRAFKQGSPFAWVGLGHLAVLLLMMMSFMMPPHSRPPNEVVDVSQITAQVVSGPSFEKIGSTAPASTESKLSQALSSFGQVRTRPSSTGRKFSGVSFEPKASVPSSPLIKFNAPGGVEGPALNVSESEIAKVLSPAQSKLKECYDDALIQDSNLAGRPQIVITIAKAGHVEDVFLNYVKGSPKGLSVLKKCFHTTLSSLRFPAANQSFAVTQTLILTR